MTPEETNFFTTCTKHILNAGLDSAFNKLFIDVYLAIDNENANPESIEKVIQSNRNKGSQHSPFHDMDIDIVALAKDKEKSSLLELLKMVLGTFFATRRFPFYGDNLAKAKTKPEHMLSVFVKNIDSITDEQVKYDALRILDQGKYSKPLRIKIRTLRARSPLARVYDFFNLATAYGRQLNPDMCNVLFTEAEAKLQDLIKTEIKKTIPDVSHIEKEIEDLRIFAKYVGDDDLENQIAQKYKIDTILNPDINIEYKSPIQGLMEQNAILMEQNAILMAENAEIKGKLKETQEGWRETTEKLKESQIEIQKQRAINEGANAKLSKEKERTQRLIDATDQLKIGIGSRGIKKMRETVEQIEHEKRKIER
ncbi:MAG: hypothetical protein IJY99_01280 [Alphaproteobacteria bacterium]|nr:hypothetical protein [Alphaproteobacteria bacterium]